VTPQRLLWRQRVKKPGPGWVLHGVHASRDAGSIERNRGCYPGVEASQMSTLKDSSALRGAPQHLHEGHAVFLKASRRGVRTTLVGGEPNGTRTDPWRGDEKTAVIAGQPGRPPARATGGCAYGSATRRGSEPGDGSLAASGSRGDVHWWRASVAAGSRSLRAVPPSAVIRTPLSIHRGAGVRTNAGPLSVRVPG